MFSWDRWSGALCLTDPCLAAPLDHPLHSEHAKLYIIVPWQLVWKSEPGMQTETPTCPSAHRTELAVPGARLSPAALAQSPEGRQDNGSWQLYSNCAINHPKGALDQPTRGNYLDSWLTTTSQELSFISSHAPSHSCRNANQLLELRPGDFFKIVFTDDHLSVQISLDKLLLSSIFILAHNLPYRIIYFGIWDGQENGYVGWRIWKKVDFQLQHKIMKIGCKGDVKTSDGN